MFNAEVRVIWCVLEFWCTALRVWAASDIERNRLDFFKHALICCVFSIFDFSSQNCSVQVLVPALLSLQSIVKLTVWAGKPFQALGTSVSACAFVSVHSDIFHSTSISSTTLLLYSTFVYDILKRNHG